MKSRTLRNGLLLIISVLHFQVVWGGELQRLFTTPEERRALDENRFRPPPPPPTDQELKTQELPDPPRFITFNGMVHLPQYTTIWVNNDSQLNQQSFQVQPNTDSTISIILPKTKVTTRLHAGQTLDTANNQVLEAYQPIVESTLSAHSKSWLKNTLSQ